MTETKKALAMEIVGIKCDVEGCDYEDDEVRFGDIKVGDPCPKCGANLLTQADMDSIVAMQEVADLINEMYPDVTGEKHVSFEVKMDGSGTMDIGEVYDDK
jgi:hypothetical protein